MLWALLLPRLVSSFGSKFLGIPSRLKNNLRAWDGVYGLEASTGQAVAESLAHLSPRSAALVFSGGLLSALSPCSLSMLPVVTGYLASEAQSDEDSGDNLLPYAACYAVGLATSLATLGLSAAAAGNLWGSLGLFSIPKGSGAAALSVVAGLNLLGLVEIELPNAFRGTTVRTNQEPPANSQTVFGRSARAAAAGAASGLVSSPCTTPALASLLGFVASSSDPATGGAFLLLYSTGLSTPVGCCPPFINQSNGLLLQLGVASLSCSFFLLCALA